MRVECAARKADIGRSVLAEPFHQVIAAANRADRQAAAEGLAVGHEVGPHAEIFLGAAGCEAEADKDLIEDQYDAALGADRAELLQPIGIGRAVETRLPGLSTKVESAGAALFGCMICTGLTRTQAMSRRVRSTRSDASDMFFECVCLMRRHRVADTRLHVAPPLRCDCYPGAGSRDSRCQHPPALSRRSFEHAVPREGRNSLPGLP